MELFLPANMCCHVTVSTAPCARSFQTCRTKIVMQLAIGQVRWSPTPTRCAASRERRLCARGCPSPQRALAADRLSRFNCVAVKMVPPS
eukprot:7411415-Alexandrium_andersonii.AAC.1